MTNAIPMTDSKNLIRLMAWLSPSFPTGAFSYSHGLETVADGFDSADDLHDWIAALLQNGSAWNDAVLLAQAWRGDDVEQVAELALALAGSKERHDETLNQGQAFMTAAEPWLTEKPVLDQWPLPVAVGHVAAQNDIALQATLTAFLHAFVSNQIQASLRLMSLGQKAGVALLHGFEPLIEATASRAATSTLHDLGSATLMAEVAAMKHETLTSRIFRT